MKLTETKLRQIIKEELSEIGVGSMAAGGKMKASMLTPEEAKQKAVDKLRTAVERAGLGLTVRYKDAGLAVVRIYDADQSQINDFAKKQDVPKIVTLNIKFSDSYFKVETGEIRSVGGGQAFDYDEMNRFIKHIKKNYL